MTPEQEKLIPVYQEKWMKIVRSTERVDRDRAEKNIKAAYELMGEKEPEVIFCDSPYAALDVVDWYDKESSLMGTTMGLPPQCFYSDPLRMNPHFDSGAITIITNLIYMRLEEMVVEDWKKGSSWKAGPLFDYGYDYSLDPSFCGQGIDCDFALSVLEVDCDIKYKLYFNSLVNLGGWIFAQQKACIVCDRPTKMCLDDEQRPHAEGFPAIQFSDGFSVYAYHGVKIPEKYGKIHPQQWQSQWLLEEKNAELRRVLILGIGYERISQELQATILDKWREYTLLRIDSDVDIEPMNMLKMTCASTGYIHCLRVPPDVQNAREAIRWVNWDIDPKSFAIET